MKERCAISSCINRPQYRLYDTTLCRIHKIYYTNKPRSLKGAIMRQGYCARHGSNRPNGVSRSITKRERKRIR